MGRVLAIVVACAVACVAPRAVHAQSDNLADVMIDTAEAPTHWTLIDEERAWNTDAMRGITAAARQLWRYRDETFTILYFACDGLESAAALYQRHATLFGEDALVVPLGSMVVELHGAPEEAWPDAAMLCKFDAAQQRKLVAAALPAGWRLMGEFLASPQAVAKAAETLAVPVQLILVQQLRSSEGVVHINFVLCVDGNGASQVYERYSASNPETFVTLQGPVIVELIGDNRRVLLPTLELLEAAPLLPHTSSS